MTVDEKVLNKRRKSARIIRYFRKIHRQTAVFLFLAFFIMAGTGLLLTWKKNSGGLILAKTESGTSTQLSEWLPLDSLQFAAVSFLQDSISPSLSAEIDRIDVRPGKGIVKFTFVGHYKGLQVDGATGRILKVENRNSDLIEHIHDGSILDFLFGTGTEIFKLIYSTIMGIALLLFTITGIWIWWGPKRMRKHL